VTIRVRDQHPEAALLPQENEHNADLKMVLRGVVKELTEILDGLETLEKLLERGYPDHNVFSQYRPPIGSEEESH